MSASRTVADVAARVRLLIAARDLATTVAANDNDCRPCAIARRRGAYVCPHCAGRGVLW